MEKEPLAVSPKTAFDMIDVGVTKGYELINSGELESFTIGRSRKVTFASIKSLIERRLASNQEAA